ncbi:nitroreductase [Secundilactobacillus oryzae JCM 18671]|uniref:Nitroreductase n=1 Tax=Secundilactobacillus oryzae JCM 18671 TaxID=1291743 RepID=A0A081BK75_9LACO|nr:nitroreductase family protein [Secundilactobacillus oryzae]GAK48443.1 nitroreductase [Secundilactobacillus oryzae JCM 18671]
MTNFTMNQLTNHKSIRSFTNEKLTEAEINSLVSAAQHASTSTFSQQYSIISVTDAKQKQILGEISGHHWLENSGHFFLMVVDQYRNLQLADQAGAKPDVLGTTDKFLAGVMDAAIATESIMVAAESMGLGGTIMGSILNDSKRVIDTFKLPQLTFPILGIALGHPAATPSLKPRLPEALMHFDGQYALPADFETQMADYDIVLQDYYHYRDSNTRDENFSHHIVKELSRDPRLRAELKSVIEAQGFMADFKEIN